VCISVMIRKNRPLVATEHIVRRQKLQNTHYLIFSGRQGSKVPTVLAGQLAATCTGYKNLDPVRKGTVLGARGVSSYYNRQGRG
jgi:hypothetical protein